MARRSTVFIHFAETAVRRQMDRVAIYLVKAARTGFPAQRLSQRRVQSEVKQVQVTGSIHSRTATSHGPQ